MPNDTLLRVFSNRVILSCILLYSATSWFIYVNDNADLQHMCTEVLNLHTISLLFKFMQEKLLR